MENVKELTEFMGGGSVIGFPKSDFEFIEIIRAGFPAKVIACVVKSSAISEEVICQTRYSSSASKCQSYQRIGGSIPRQLNYKKLEQTGFLG